MAETHCTKTKDLSGRTFGRLTVLERLGTRRHKTLWRCRCSCAAKTVLPVLAASLMSGNTRSCGCLKRERDRTFSRSHGHTAGRKTTPEYRAYRNMLARCYHSGRREFHHYGGRGVKVCERWRGSFAAFFEDVGPRPSARHSLDRFPDMDGDYRPGNVRWATKVEQNNNQRDNRRLAWRGETLTLCQWAARLGVKRQMLARRLNEGWPVDEALSVPPRAWRRTPEERKARAAANRAVSRAVEAGRMPRASSLACAGCGQPARQYHHHRGYEPRYRLDVVPLCVRCHGRAGGS